MNATTGSMKTMEAVKAFTVNRAVWLRGKSYSTLLRLDGCGCILGHYLLACGVAPEALLDRATTNSVFLTKEERAWAPAWLLPRGGVDGSLHIMAVNDGQFNFISEEGRERILVEEFKRRGVELTFTGEGRP